MLDERNVCRHPPKHESSPLPRRQQVQDRPLHAEDRRRTHAGLDPVSEASEDLQDDRVSPVHDLNDPRCTSLAQDVDKPALHARVQVRAPVGRGRYDAVDVTVAWCGFNEESRTSHVARAEMEPDKVDRLAIEEDAIALVLPGKSSSAFFDGNTRQFSQEGKVATRRLPEYTALGQGSAVVRDLLDSLTAEFEEVGVLQTPCLRNYGVKPPRGCAETYHGRNGLGTLEMQNLNLPEGSWGMRSRNSQA